MTDRNRSRSPVRSTSPVRQACSWVLCFVSVIIASTCTPCKGRSRSELNAVDFDKYQRVLVEQCTQVASPAAAAASNGAASSTSSAAKPSAMTSKIHNLGFGSSEDSDSDSNIAPPSKGKNQRNHCTLSETVALTST
eukprot:21420-Heterococcus_DN1.PRE.2